MESHAAIQNDRYKWTGKIFILYYLIKKDSYEINIQEDSRGKSSKMLEIFFSVKWNLGMIFNFYISAL